MPVHRIKKGADTSAALQGASPATVGITFDSTGAVSTRNAITASPKFSVDGLTTQGLLDGVWGTKVLTDATATSLIDIACAASAMVGGLVTYLLEYSDGTDFQAVLGQVAYAAVNKAGTHTATVSPVNAAGNQTTVSGCDARALSGGTLTLTAWTIVTGTNKVTLKINADTSLTSTTIRITYFVTPFRGVVTVL